MSPNSKLDTGNIFRVDGLITVITDGRTGIGLMMARAVVRNGATKVYVVGGRKAKLEQAAK